ncbi:MAG: ABC transporter permease, partial [Patescibacteria group bacterium]
FTNSDFAISNGKMINESFLPIVLVITILGFLTGTVVVGLTVYNATVEKLSEFGVLKAIGASNTKLFLIVFEQALWSSLLGFVAGMVLAWVVIKAVVSLVPIMTVELNSTIYIIAFVTAVMMSIVASYLPVKKISGLDPAIVFRKQG